MYNAGLFDLSNKVVAISGASGYLGTIITSYIASKGASLAVFDIPNAKDKLDQLSKAVYDEFGINTKNYTVNITNENEVKALANDIFTDFGHIDGLVNIAGINRHGSLFEHTYDDFMNLLSVNVAGTFNCCKNFAKYMAKQKNGSIINISSMNGTVSSLPPKSMIAYDTSKAAIIHMTHTMAGELGCYNIRCNTVSPGILEKGMSHIKGFQPAEETYLKKVIDMTPIKRNIKPDELAGAIIYLLSDASSATTGIDIKIDGGYGVW